MDEDEKGRDSHLELELLGALTVLSAVLTALWLALR